MRTLSVQASRGCPYECSFCQTPVVWSNLWTKKSASSVVDEIEILAERYEINSLFFRDEEFTIKSSWVMEICREIIRRGLPQYMDWGSYCRVDDITPELAQTLAEAGYVYGFLGIESGDPETRDKLHKYYKQEEAERAIALFDKYDITSHAGMIVGFPWDTEESIEHSLRWILTLPLDFLTVSFATPFPGTQLRKDVKDQGLLLSDNPDCYTLLQPIIQVPRIPMDRLKELPSQISRRFYLRPRYAAHIVKRLIRRPARMQVIAELIYNRLRMGQRTHVLRTDGNRITSAHGSGGSPEAAKSGVSRAVSRQGRAEAISTGTRSA